MARAFRAAGWIAVRGVIPGLKVRFRNGQPNNPMRPSGAFDELIAPGYENVGRAVSVALGLGDEWQSWIGFIPSEYEDIDVTPKMVADRLRKELGND